MEVDSQTCRESSKRQCYKKFKQIQCQEQTPSHNISADAPGTHQSIRSTLSKSCLKIQLALAYRLQVARATQVVDTYCLQELLRCNSILDIGVRIISMFLRVSWTYAINRSISGFGNRKTTAEKLPLIGLHPPNCFLSDLRIWPSRTSLHGYQHGL
jgi:hypothetical protein